MGVETMLARSAISSGCVGSRGSTWDTQCVSPSIIQQRHRHRSRLGSRSLPRCTLHAVRTFDEHRLQRLQHPRELLRHALVHAPVEVDTDVDPGRLDLLHARDRVLEQRRGVDPVHALRAVHLHGGEALRTARRGAVRDVRGLVAPDPAVHLHAVAHLPAEELPDRHAEPLALDVPQRDVKSGEGGLGSSGRRFVSQLSESIVES